MDEGSFPEDIEVGFRKKRRPTWSQILENLHDETRIKSEKLQLFKRLRIRGRVEFPFQF